MQRFRRPVKVACLRALLLLCALPGCGDDDDPEQLERDRVEQGLQISPVPVDLEGRDRGLVGLGSYIVNAQGGCNDCHTNPPFTPDGNPFEGEPKQVDPNNYLRGGTVFPPSNVVAPSLRPDASGRPFGEDLDEFIELMRTGREEDGELLQVMPWPVYQDMTDRDLRAIYEYLSAIPR